MVQLTETTNVAFYYLGNFLMIWFCEWLFDLFLKWKRFKENSKDASVVTENNEERFCEWLFELFLKWIKFIKDSKVIVLIYFIFAMLKLQCIFYIISLLNDEFSCISGYIFAQIAYGAQMISYPFLSLIQLVHIHWKLYKDQPTTIKNFVFWIIVFVLTSLAIVCFVLWSGNLVYLLWIGSYRNNDPNFKQGECISVPPDVNTEAYYLFIAEDSGTTVTMIVYTIVHIYIFYSHSRSNVNRILKVFLRKLVALLVFIMCYNSVCWLDTDALTKEKAFAKSEEPNISLLCNSIFILAMGMVILWPKHVPNNNMNVQQVSDMEGDDTHTGTDNANNNSSENNGTQNTNNTTTTEQQFSHEHLDAAQQPMQVIQQPIKQQIQKPIARVYMDFPEEPYNEHRLKNQLNKLFNKKGPENTDEIIHKMMQMVKKDKIKNENSKYI